MIHVGVGQAEGIDTIDVMRAILADCDRQLGHLPAKAGIVFAGSGFNHRIMLEAINLQYPGIELVGCTTAGDFSTILGFSDDSITLMLFASDQVEISAGLGRDLRNDPAGAVQSAVDEALDGLSGPPVFGLAFPDGYDRRFDPIMEMINKALGLACPVFGGAAGAQWMDGHKILQFYKTEVVEDAIPMLLWSGSLSYAFSIANSWQPVGKKTRVRASKGRVVERIGDFTAIDFYRHYLGDHTEPAREFILAVYEAGKAYAYLRAPVSYNADGSITFSESIPQGATVQLTEAIRDVIFDDTRRTADHLAGNIDFTPDFALAFSCAFRKEVLGTRTKEELQILQHIFPPQLPIGGFYSYGEIAPLEPRQPTLMHGATLITLLVGYRGRRSQAQPVARPARVQFPDRKVPETEADRLTAELTFLKRKLKRSEGYRKRSEDIKDFNAAMHRTILQEVEDARVALEQKDAALRKSEEKFRRIVETTGEGFVLMDEHMKIVDMNDAYCRLTGYAREELLGKSPLDITTETYRQAHLANREEILARQNRKIESVIVKKDGHHVPILIHGNALKDDAGEVIGNMAFVTDMTEHKKALTLAGEVQKNLLPRDSPAIPGFGLAGRNVPCDEIGGDYFDYFWHRESPWEPFSIVVGDITGHGVDSALLMSSTRAFLRMRAEQPGTLAEIVSAMNVQLARDVLDSGIFMTLFYLTVDPVRDQIHWVRAGHDPAILYDPNRDEFAELIGEGIALGVDAGYDYQENRKRGIRAGQVLAIGTDGIWESTNPAGEMFGKARYKEMVRRHAEESADGILNAVFDELAHFTEGRKSEDDITLVILKIDDPGAGI